MIQFRIHGRGGQGGVTLAKMIAFMYWTEGKWVQAFGSYSAERTGAPVMAFALADDELITNRSRVYYPDHLIIVDSTLLSDSILSGLRWDGTLLIDTPRLPTEFVNFSGRRIATIDAKKIARRHKLGTRTTPITNSAIAGAFCRVFDLKFDSVAKMLTSMGLSAANLQAAKDAYDGVAIERMAGEPKIVPVIEPTEPIPPLVTGNIGSEPKLNIADWKSREPVYVDKVPPCNFNCPAGNDVRGFVKEMALGRFDQALEILRETSPLPGTTSRVCPHFCEEYCNRVSLDARLNVHALERTAADLGKTSPKKLTPTKKERIAIIGSGPAGLSAAYHLSKLGYVCKIFEALAEPGGMLRAGIPDFRLPKEILQKEVTDIVAQGVEIACNSPIKSQAQFEGLLKDYQAVIVATGMSMGRDIRLPGAVSDRVIQGIEFLKKVNFGEKVSLGKKVIVIGGGNTAIDTSRVALRIGASDVTIVYRRSREEMPAIREEIEAAIAEGVKLKFLHSPEKIETRGARNILKLQKMELSDAASDGRRTVRAIGGAFEDLEFDHILLATGQVADLGFLPPSVRIQDGMVEAKSWGGTSDERVFAIGDVATNDGTVTHAIGSGRRAAEAVARYLSGEAAAPALAEPQSERAWVSSEEMKLHYFIPSARAEISEQTVVERVRNFEEVAYGLSSEEGIQEALRCLSCGTCNGCLGSSKGKCEVFCPERAIERIGVTEVRVNLKNCKGCLICMEVCPRSGIQSQGLVKGETVA